MHRTYRLLIHDESNNNERELEEFCAKISQIKAVIERIAALGGDVEFGGDVN